MISMPDRPKYNRQAAGKAWFDPTIEEWPEGKPLPTRCSCLALAYKNGPQQSRGINPDVFRCVLVHLFLQTTTGYSWEILETK